jgi:hypothetical protein
MSENENTYEQFMRKVETILKAKPAGLTWTEIKKELNLPQRVPNNKWVRQMETDIGLTRTMGNKGMLWRIR